jgi:hypothetical protein
MEFVRVTRFHYPKQIAKYPEVKHRLQKGWAVKRNYSGWTDAFRCGYPVFRMDTTKYRLTIDLNSFEYINIDCDYFIGAFAAGPDDIDTWISVERIRSSPIVYVEMLVEIDPRMVAFWQAWSVPLCDDLRRAVWGFLVHN